MLTIGPRCRIIGMRPELNFSLTVVNSILGPNVHMEISHLTDGVHSRASIHYAGGAWDGIFKTELTQEEKFKLYKGCNQALGQDFDLIFESIGTPNEHFHCEYQPKRSY